MGVDGPGIESRLGGNFSRTLLERPWKPPGLLQIGNRVSFPGVKSPVRGVDHPPPHSADIEERVELNVYYPLGLRSLLQGAFYIYPFTTGYNGVCGVFCV